ncbi:hypothetical Protein YC6258_03088 [Gynuella sunshinyii YC6258]|uniref:Uncharacterized protein n=1 Tax=Gynuella sunshinyii YC6258 TaxID=1445510 RepID=A0A0C5VXH3_9GAMM|nr:hypothetical Protein YC6258_03088 [Gynuella sunshinyii YC6258]
MLCFMFAASGKTENQKRLNTAKPAISPKKQHYKNISA